MKPGDMKVCVCVGSEQIIEYGRVEGWGRESISFSEGVEIPVRLTSLTSQGAASKCSMLGL